MTQGGGYQAPFGGDPFGAQPFSPEGVSAGPAGPPGFGHQSPGFGPQPQQGQGGTLATLSIVFGFLFPPAGAVLGHLALSRINRTHEPGRERAIVGLVISYLVIVLLVLGLLVWLITGRDSDSAEASSPPSTTAAIAHPSPPPPRTTVITPPPAVRPTVSAHELRVGDCIEVQKESRDKDDPNLTVINIYRTACELRDGVEQVKQVLSTNSCNTVTVLTEELHKDLFVCVEDFKG